MFETPISRREGILLGPFRAPKQMLAVQQYDGHATIHDDQTAQKLGFKGGTIEGPTHFSQFVPLACALWGDDFLVRGCLSAHYKNAAFEGDQMQAAIREPASGERHAEIWMTRSDGAEILRGTASLQGGGVPSEVEARLASLSPLVDPVILADVKVGMRTPRLPVRMDLDQQMGALYPFSLREKLSVITEPSPCYSGPAAGWSRPIVPFEMVSVLMQYAFPPGSDFPARGPTVDLFADQEISLLDGPVFVGEDYEVVREVIFMSGSRRTESLWTRTSLFTPGTDREVARMVLNLATLKESYAPYAAERTALYGETP